ncbi:helix-turn-helix domain-containing protein [Mycobacterium palustre]|uniref:helix-turn-helix domain-containing protein n=1 Tax=Mycobacterium palustre TaxID=153971 RepID=UPI00115052E5|nr:helix-turn-helix domain-containing protein [Mycobacterium palustre]MCV7101533.1 helix-turn-helix domain-containing protein [Mycobacterium palustre]
MTISFAAAADLVGVIDALAVRCAPQVLSARVVALRNDLIGCCSTRVTARFDASAEVVGADEVLALDPRGLVDVKAAAARLGITEDGVRWLCKRGRLAASKISGRWWIEPASIAMHDRRGNPWPSTKHGSGRS